MARRSRRSSKIQTAEKTFIFDLSEDAEANVTGTKYVDLAQVASLVNRRGGYRQGYEYVVQSLEIGCNGGGQFTATVYRLPEHWPCINAWEKAMRLWKEQQDDAADEASQQSVAARYRDFKVHFDTAHVTAGFGNNLLPSGYLINDPVGTGEGYEWEASEVVLPNFGGVVGATTERELHMLGDDNGTTSAGVIKAYGESRSRPSLVDPNTVDVPLGGLFGQMFDVGMDDSDILENLREHNREPPYLTARDTAQEYYPGGSFQGIGPLDGGGNAHPGQLLDVLAINANHNFNSDTMAGFVAPCGLVKIEYSAQQVLPGSPPAPGMPPMSFWMKIVLAPGDYKGLLAQSMQEAN